MASGAGTLSSADTFFNFLFFFPVTSVTFLFRFAILQQRKEIAKYAGNTRS